MREYARDVYEEAASIVCLVMGGSCRIKSALYGNRFTSDLRVLYAISGKTLQSHSLILKIIKKSDLASIVSNGKSADQQHLFRSDANTYQLDRPCDRCLLSVLVHDRLFDSRQSDGDYLNQWLYQLTGDDRVVQKLRTAQQLIKREGLVEEQPSKWTLPCYARINELLADMESVKNELYACDFQEVQYDKEDTSYKRFIKIVANLESNQFTIDFHLPHNLLVFPGGTCLYDLSLVRTRSLILQDKASCIPVECLYPTGDVLDACAAPGNKTSQLVTKMSDSATLFALDRDPTRFRHLCENLQACGVRRLNIDGPAVEISRHRIRLASSKTNQPNVEARCTDFLSLDPSDPQFAKVEAIILDPSCSGSGLSARQPDGSTNGASGSVDDDNVEGLRQRLERLSNLQAKLLRHALSFPNVKQVVYSTCSIRKEENEIVVCENLERFSDTFELERIWWSRSDKHRKNSKPLWPNRGLTEFRCDPCLRATPTKDLTNGFFVASFIRSSCQSDANESKTGSRKRSRPEQTSQKNKRKKNKSKRSK